MGAKWDGLIQEGPQDANRILLPKSVTSELVTPNAWMDCTPITAYGVTWAHYNTGNQKVQARLSLDGSVQLRGWMCTTAGVYGYGFNSALMFTLPASIPSLNQRVVAVPKVDNIGQTGMVRVDFYNTTAQVMAFHGGAGDNGTANYLSLDGVSFEP